MMKSISRFILYSVIISLFMSCFRELEAESTQKTGVPVQVSMHIKVPSFTSPQGATRSATEPAADDSGFKVHLVEQDEQKAQTRSSGTTSLYNLWVLQFASDNTVRKISKIANVPAPVKDMITIDAELFTGSNQTIYLVALGKQYESIDLSGVTNISELENFAIPFVKYENGMAMPIITEEEDIPYQGSQSGLTIVQIEKGGRGLIEYDPSMNFSGAINIRAMVSKVSANLSFDVSDMTPYLLMLNNVPTSFAINNPSYIASGFANMPAIEIASGSLTEGNRHTYSWYMAPNPQGVVSTITSESSRYYYIQKNGTPTGTAPKNGTYLNFWASSNISSDTYAQYYIFLGNNTTNDFNIYANTSYNLRSDINSIEYLTDKRIVYGTLVQSIDFAATTLIGSPTKHNIRIDGNYSFDAHPDMRPIEISALRGTVKIEVLQSATDTQPIALADSWLKLSAYPNYTEAVNKQRVADPEGLVTSITKNATIPSVYKFYLYSDEYLEYAPSLGAAQLKNRDLYIRFTFHVSALVPDDVTTVKMTQRPAFYLGQFGGTFNENTGEYSDGLVFESMEELNTYVKYLSYYASPKTISKGIYDAPYDVLFDTYKVGDVRNGKEATLCGATNIGNKKLIPDPKLTAEEPKYVGGKLDLYQYSIQKLNYFSARYCYDKNRDTNGDGVINLDEYHWYMPAHIQYQAFTFNAFGDLRSVISNVSTPFASISQDSKNNAYVSVSYSFRYTAAYYSSLVTPRCVRDVSSDPGMPGGFKAYAEDGYAVIDAMGMSPSVREDRATNPQLIINDRGRVIRHYEPGGITATSSTVMSKVPARFRVAPFDINTLGIERDYKAPSNGLMSWSHASGYNQVGNSWVMSEESNPLGIAQTGCPMYAGKSGNEAGKWRLPTESELALIEMMDATLMKTTDQTGYKTLTASPSSSSTNFYAYYWSSTEYSTSDGQPVKSALKMNYVKSYRNGLLDIYNKRQFTIADKTEKYFVRCIRDLPER